MKITKHAFQILVVDDSAETREIIKRNLMMEGYNIRTSSTVADAIAVLADTEINLVITDLKIPEVSGLDLIRYIHENKKETKVIMITGHPTYESAIQSIKLGAEDYLLKPFTDEELITIVNNILKEYKNSRITPHKAEKNPVLNYGIIGNSKGMRELYKKIMKLTNTDDSILITGESGTGKELVARALHYTSNRASGPFVPVNCSAIPDNLFESELFGHIKGAFTGAFYSKAGLFQTAHEGTIFLDEISELSPLLQAKLLRVLQDKVIYMIGSSQPQKIDVRIIAATNRSLSDMIDKNLFRNDLFYRLNVISLHIPPLRDRGDDIIILAKHFLDTYSHEIHNSNLTFSQKVLQTFQSYNWPGNVRELENLIKSMVILSEDTIIDIADLPAHMKSRFNFSTNLQKTLKEVEAEYIAKVLEDVNNNKTKAARILGIDRKTLREKIKTD